MVRPAATLIALILALSIDYLVVAAHAETEPDEQSKTILDEAGLQGGLIVTLGCDDGRLLAALGTNQRFLVQGLLDDPAPVAAARDVIKDRGLYGRVSARYWKADYLPYTDNLVNLIVIGPPSNVDRREIERVLCPGGVAIRVDQGMVPQDRFVKPIPNDIDQWTHYLHDAGNNAVAEDDRVGPPQYLQWKSGPLWCRSHEFASSVQTLISANGRLIGVIDEGIIGQPRGVPALWALIARDAFNGVLLWRRPCDRIPPHALVAVGDRIYVTLESKGPLTILDAATGETMVDCPWTGKVHEISFDNDRLILAAQLPGEQTVSIVAADPADGSLLWHSPAESIAANSMVCGQGRVCYSNGKELVCLAQDDGRPLWRVSVKTSGKGYAVLYQNVVFLTGGKTQAFDLDTGELLWTGPDGSPHARNPPGLFGARGLIWTAWGDTDPRSFIWQHRPELRNGYDPVTGEVRKTVTAERLVTAGHHIRCYPPKATHRYLMLNKRGVEFFDLEGDNHMRANWTRGACGFGMLPANGLLYTPPSQCFCYPGVLLSGMNALAAAREPLGLTSDDAERGGVERGPAYGIATSFSGNLQNNEDDWPTYRHDMFRSGAVDQELPVQWQRLWETTVCPPAYRTPDGGGEANGSLRPYRRGELTPPIAADGKVFVVASDAHTIYALDAQNGRKLWSFVADGRVDSPPTIYGSLCLFGGTDGYVYCLSTEDGRLVWRFQAAPDARMICAMGQLESTWPVHGSVLVRDGKVYCTAGRSSYLDGGIYLYALDPRTGEMVHEYLFESPEPDVTRYGGRPFDMEGTKSDILVSGPEDLYLFQNRFSPELSPKPMPRITKLGDRRCEPHLITTDGFLDKAWFNRTYWTYGDRWPGYYFSYRGPKSGQLVVFDNQCTYALKVYTERRGHSPEFAPGTGYLLIADRNRTEPVLDEMDIGAEKGRGYTRTELPIWTKRVPVRAQGMVLARGHLYIVGPPDLAGEQEAYEAMIGLRGSVFRVVSTSDGETLAEIEMDEAPVFDGLIAAGRRLYMSTLEGTVICLGAEP